MKKTKSQPTKWSEERQNVLSSVPKYGTTLALLLLLCSFGASPAADAAPPPSQRWIGTWSASPEAEPNQAPLAGPEGATFRNIVHISIGGTSVRVILTNEFGLGPVTVGESQIAISAGSGAIELSTAKKLSFGGQASVTLPAGALMVSDPVELKLAPASDVAVSLFLPAQTILQSTVHSYALQTNYKAYGNVVEARVLPYPSKVSS